MEAVENKLKELREAISSSEQSLDELRTQRDELIKRLIRTHRYTQQQVAQIAGVSQNWVSQLTKKPRR